MQFHPAFLMRQAEKVTDHLTNPLHPRSRFNDSAVSRFRDASCQSRSVRVLSVVALGLSIEGCPQGSLAREPQEDRRLMNRVEDVGEVKLPAIEGGNDGTGTEILEP